MDKTNGLISVGKRIKELRKQKQMSLREAAIKSDVSAGLFSKIENFRTMPSLPVLHNIALALDVPLMELVRDVGQKSSSNYFVIRNNERETEEREDSQGLSYELIISDQIGNKNLRANIITVQPNSYRKPISTDAKELLYLIDGELHYGLDDEIILLQKGDALYFDGSIPHSVENKSDLVAVMFKLYLINQSND